MHLGWEVDDVGLEVDDVGWEVDVVGWEVDDVGEEVDEVGEEVDEVGLGFFRALYGGNFWDTSAKPGFFLHSTEMSKMTG